MSLVKTPVTTIFKIFTVIILKPLTPKILNSQPLNS